MIITGNSWMNGAGDNCDDGTKVQNVVCSIQGYTYLA